MTIKSAGFITTSMISSQNALNFAYALYLRLRQDPTMSEGERKSIVRRWFVMSMMTDGNSGKRRDAVGTRRPTNQSYGGGCAPQAD